MGLPAQCIGGNGDKTARQPHAPALESSVREDIGSRLQKFKAAQMSSNASGGRFLALSCCPPA